MTLPKTILLIGSAPDAVRAEILNGALFQSIVAINNAWQIRPDWTHGIYPDDFAKDRRPVPTPPQSVVTSAEFVPANNSLGGIVYAGATMAFTAAYWALETLKPERMAFIGCDMIYDGVGKSHFYGEGTADPLRDDPTLQILEAKSNRFMALAKRNDCICLNLSDKPRSRLTFARADNDLKITTDLPILIDEEIDKALGMEHQAAQYYPSGDYWNGVRPLDKAALLDIDEQWMKTVIPKG